jgi:hypothetical protein
MPYQLLLFLLLLFVVVEIVISINLWRVGVCTIAGAFFLCSSGTDSTCIKQLVQKFKSSINCCRLSSYRRIKTLCGSVGEIPVRVQPYDWTDLCIRYLSLFLVSSLSLSEFSTRCRTTTSALHSVVVLHPCLNSSAL